MLLYLPIPSRNHKRMNPLEIWEDLKQVYPDFYALGRQCLVVVAASASKVENTITREKRLSRAVVESMRWYGPDSSFGVKATIRYALWQIMVLVLRNESLHN